MEAATSEFLLIFHEQPQRYHELPLEARRQALARCNAWRDELAAQERLLHGDTPGAERRLVAPLVAPWTAPSPRRRS